MSKQIDLTASPSRREARSIARSLAFANDTSHRRHSPVLRHVVPGRPLQVPAGATRRAASTPERRVASARVPGIGGVAGRPTARPAAGRSAATRTARTTHSGGALPIARPIRAGGLVATASAARPRTTTGTSSAASTPRSSTSAGSAAGLSSPLAGEVRLLTSGAAALAPRPRELAPEADRGRSLRVVPPLRRRARRNRRSALVVLTVAGIAFLAVMMHASLAENQFRLDKVNNSIASAERRNQALRLQVAQLESPERVVRRAEQLGLSAPEQVTFLSPTAGARSVTATGTTASPIAAPPTVAPTATADADTTASSVVVSSMAAPDSTVPLAGGRVARGPVR